jgi:glutathione S-transferase
MTKASERYELYYWPGIEGRGEFVRLAFEEADVPYVDVARLPESEGGGVKAMLRLLRGDGTSGFRPFAPPVIKLGDRVVSQTANILQWLAPRLGLVPEDEQSRLEAHAIQLTIADLVSEVHDTHHPISSGLYYEDQKVEAKRRAAAFVAERMPKYLGWLEDLLRRNTASEGRHLVGVALSYVDLSAFQVVNGIAHAFPKGLARIEKDLPLLLALKDRVATRPRVAAYLGSDRRKPFDLNGLFRRYPELDG